MTGIVSAAAAAASAVIPKVLMEQGLKHTPFDLIIKQLESAKSNNKFFIFLLNLPILGEIFKNAIVAELTLQGIPPPLSKKIIEEIKTPNFQKNATDIIDLIIDMIKETKGDPDLEKIEPSVKKLVNDILKKVVIYINNTDNDLSIELKQYTDLSEEGIGLKPVYPPPPVATGPAPAPPPVATGPVATGPSGGYKKRKRKSSKRKSKRKNKRTKRKPRKQKINKRNKKINKRITKRKSKK